MEMFLLIVNGMKKIKKLIRFILIKIKRRAGVIESTISIGKNKILFNNVEFLNSEIGEYSYIAKNSILHNTTIGKFCSIGPNVVVGYGDHPTKFLSTSPAFYSKHSFFDIGTTKDLFFGHSRVEIGNDVWIGANVFVKNGIIIGDGAIIGAGAVIIRDVEPYSIIVGVPGKIKSKRFSNEIIDELLQIKWWDWPISIIKEHHLELSSENIIKNLGVLIDIKNKIK
jgi:acetyltransferase-like isoleucine patch superfamily enzyme